MKMQEIKKMATTMGITAGKMKKKRTYQGHPVSGRELSLFPNKRI